MAQLIILGSSNAVATPGHENTHLVLVGSTRTIMIDCVSSPLLRLREAGVAFEQVTDLILTHFHPDHVSGVPLMLMDMWLLGRRAQIHVYGLSHTLERIQSLMDLYGWSSWPDFFPVSFDVLPEQELTKVLDSEDFRVLCSPVRHLIPTIGLRIECASSGKVIAYSCDTEPSEAVARLAAGGDILIHEAAGRGRGHSSARQAAEVARQAEVGRLILIHYPTGAGDPAELVRDAKTAFHGDVQLAQDFMSLELE
jgi:ribonuclease Z